jgi:sugar phosphate permease
LTAEQRAWRWRILISTFLGYAGYYFCRKVFGLVKTSLDEQFGWGMDSIAWIWAAFLVAYMVGQFVNGFIGRKWGPRVLLLGGLGLSIVCNVAFSLVDSRDVILVSDRELSTGQARVNDVEKSWPAHGAEAGPVLYGDSSFTIDAEPGTQGSLEYAAPGAWETVWPNDYFFTHVYLERAVLPSRIDVRWQSPEGDLAGYWAPSADADDSLAYLGQIPSTERGTWVRLGANAKKLGLSEGTRTITGIHLIQTGGTTHWDDAGVAKYTSMAYYAFLVFMIFNGLLQASGWPGSVGSVSQWIRPHERGFIMGGWGTSYVWGNIGVKLVGSTLLGLGLAAGLPGWRYAFLGCSAIAFVIWWFVYFWQRNKPEDAGLAPIVDITADEEGRAIRASNAQHVGFQEYAKLLANPLIISMGLGYFFIKFLRYALDSWLPTFLEYQGLSKQQAGIYSVLFDIGGILPCVFIGWVLDRYFNGNWARLTFIASIGLIFGYACVLCFESNPILVAICFGLVGFMIYGPDTLLCGAGAVAVAGEVNGVAVAGLVNGIGSCGPIVQELVIARILEGEDRMANIHTTNVMAFGMSIAFAAMMLVVMWRVRAAHAGNKRLDAASRVK